MTTETPASTPRSSDDSQGMSRRAVLRGAAGVGAAVTLSGIAGAALPATAAAAPATAPAAKPAPPVRFGVLPTAADLQRDVERMVGFGPRFTGSDGHNAFLDWTVQQWQAAGCTILPPDNQTFQRWLATDWSLEIIDGQGVGPVRVASYYPYGGETPAGGAIGKLVTPAQIAAGTATAAGNIILVDTGVPAYETLGQFTDPAGPVFVNWPDDSWELRNYQRLWTAAGTGGNIAGAAGAVYILDATFEACLGNYSPFGRAYQHFPALYVDRDAGAALKHVVAANPTVRMVMSADKQQVTSPSLVAMLPGAGDTDDVLIVNTHSDGPNFVEENGVVAQVELARYFATKHTRLQRTLVFSAVTGHFGPVLPQTQGFINDHPDLMTRAAAAMTLEHFGSQEWFDDASGYHATGLPEPSTAYTDPSATVTNMTIDTVKQHGLLDLSVIPAGPIYFGVGGPIQRAGVPEVSFIAGPNYLVSTGMAGPHSPYHGQLDKFDPALAARQMAWTIDVLQRLDAIPRSTLRPGT